MSCVLACRHKGMASCQLPTIIVQMAEECFRWARQAQTEDKRQAYLDVARTWLAAASGQDCGPPAQTPTLWPLNLKR